MQTAPRLPNIRVISTPTANAILLQSIGSKLRLHYGDPLHFPLPEHLSSAVRNIV